MATTAAPEATPEACPTATRIGTRCSTCMVAQCFELSTLANPCGCPAQVATAVIDEPCARPCVGGCQVSYEIKQAACGPS